MNKKSNLILQLMANCIPLLGFWLLDWNMFAIIYLYWAEGFIVAFYCCTKIAMANGSESNKSISASFYRRLLSAFKFFLFKTGILMFYWIFIAAFVAHPNGDLSIAMSAQNRHIMFFKDPMFNNALLVYVLSQLIMFLSTFIATEDYKYKPSSEYKVLFDSRTIILHIVIVLGTFGFQFFQRFEAYNSKLPALSYVLLLVLIKSITDLVQYKNYFR